MTETKVVVAIIAAAASVSAALLSLCGTFFASMFARNTQLRLEAAKDMLDRGKSERNALLDYQYDAKRRLYTECEPLIFRLVELCDDAHSRILTLARMARSANETEVENWIRSDDNRLSTLYRLMAPLAAFSLLAEKLTFFDLSLDPRMHVQYILAKTMLDTYRHDSALARAGSVCLDYRPHTPLPENEVAPPAIYSVQGISDEDLDVVLANFVEGSQASRLVISYPMFLRRRADKSDPMYSAVLNLGYFLRDFSPRSRPVLWRLMVAHAVLSSAIRFLRIYADAYRSRSRRKANRGNRTILQSGLSVYNTN